MRAARGWRVAGVADYDDPRGAARLEYAVDADDAWRTVSGSVQGGIGHQRVHLDIVRSANSRWSVNGVSLPELTGLVDLDLGFTPATNLFPLRRLALQAGESAESAAAWLDDERWIVKRLAQRYERRGADAWWYESPDTNYAGLLRVNAEGFVTEYPGLWTEEPAR